MLLVNTRKSWKSRSQASSSGYQTGRSEGRRVDAGVLLHSLLYKGYRSACFPLHRTFVVAHILV